MQSRFFLLLNFDEKTVLYQEHNFYLTRFNFPLFGSKRQETLGNIKNGALVSNGLISIQ